MKYIQENFITNNSLSDVQCNMLLADCICESSSQLFHSCVQLFTEVLKIDVAQVNRCFSFNTLLQLAVECANYEAMEYLVGRVPLEGQSILLKCVENSYYDHLKLEQRHNILHFLLDKDPSLIHETPHILAASFIHLRFIEILFKYGAELTTANLYGRNCAMNAAEFMSPDDYHKLILFLLTDCKAEYLFHENNEWSDPLGSIVEFNALLPETLELVLNIPGIDISMKDQFGNNLLFSVVYGNNLATLKRLVDCGVEYKVKGSKHKTLLHVAVKFGCVDMVNYLLSLKLDPNSVDALNHTPLHYAVHQELSIVQSLVENGANVQAKDRVDRTVLHLCAMNTEFPASTEENIKYLIRKGLGVNDGDKYGYTPLNLCMNEKFRKWLVTMVADIYAKNRKGTPAQKNSKFFLNIKF